MILAITIINLVIALCLILLEFERKENFRDQLAEFKKIRENFANDVAFQNKLVGSFVDSSTEDHSFLLTELRKIVNNNRINKTNE